MALLCALPTTAFAQTCEMKLGAMGPMSGGAAQWGLAMNSAAELAAAEVNQEGGVKIDGKTCKVTVVSYDSKYTAGRRRGRVPTRWPAQDIHIIIGPVGSAERQPASSRWPPATNSSPGMPPTPRTRWSRSFR